MNVENINYLIYMGNETTLITDEINGSIELAINTNTLLEKWCLENGSTLFGRVEAMKYWLSISKKIPVLINQENQIIMFPTESKNNIGCVWIFYNKVKKIRSITSLETKIVFKNNEELVLNLNIRVLKKQMYRCKKYLKILEETASFYATIELENR